MTSKQLRSQGLSAGAVPKGWQLVRLGDLASLRREKQKPSGNDRHPYLGLENINNWGLINSKRQFQEAISDKTVFHTGDTLYGKLRPNLRKVVRVDFDGICSTDILALFPKPLADGAFLGHILQSDRLYVHAMKGIAGTKMPRTSWEHLRAFELVCPPIPEQRAIAAVLDSIDAAIERTEAVIATTGQLRDALLHELLTRGVPGWHTEWKNVPGLGTIPADWDVVRLGDVLESTTYGTNSALSANGAIPVLRMNNLQNGQIDLSDVRRASLIEKETRELNLTRGDILFNRTNSLDLVGKVAVVRSLPQPISFASYLVRLRVQEERANPFWLSALLWSDDCQSRIRKFATPGVSQANINPTSLKTLTIPLPPLPEQRAIAAVLNGVNLAAKVAREETAGVRLLKASTAAALLSGRVRV